MKRRSRKKIDLSLCPEGQSCGSSLHQTSILKGEGDQDYQFPPTEVLVKKCLERNRQQGGRKRRGEAASADESTSPVEGTLELFWGRGGIWDLLKPAAPSRLISPEFQTLVNGSDAIQSTIIECQFDALVEDRFRDMEDLSVRAQRDMGQKFQPAIGSLGQQLARLRSSYGDALPKLLRELVARNPGVPPILVLKKAVELLDEELMPIMGVLNAYGLAFQQYLGGGRYARLLRTINFYMEQNFRLFQTGDLSGNGTKVSPLPTSAFQVGDVVLSAFGPMPLGMLPGSKGPLGIHLLFAPYDLRKWLPVGLPLLSHEGEHQLFHDVVGMEAEKRKLVAEAVRNQLRVSTPMIRVLGQNVPTVQLLAKLVSDCIGEIDADIAKILTCGPAGARSMLLSFPAMMIREGRVKDADKLLRTDSVFQLAQQPDGRIALAFEPHLTDIGRAAVARAVQIEIGFPGPAAQAWQLAVDSVGGEEPAYSQWRHDREEVGDVIRIPTVDINNATAIAVKTLIRTPMTCLNGQTMGDRQMWDARRERKADLIATNALKGKVEIPSDQGDFYAPYVAAGFTKAYWQAVAEGRDGGETLERLTETLLGTMELLEERFNKPRAA